MRRRQNNNNRDNDNDNRNHNRSIRLLHRSLRLVFEASVAARRNVASLLYSTSSRRATTTTGPPEAAAAAGMSATASDSNRNNNINNQRSHNGNGHPGFVPTSSGILPHGIVSMSWKSLPPMNQRRLGCAAVASEDGKRIYVVGGANERGEQLASVEVYLLEARRWVATTVPPLRTARQDCAAVWYRGKLVVIGGYSEQNQYLNSVEAYDFQNQRWTTWPSLQQKRRGCAATVAVLQDGGQAVPQIVVLGGSDRGCELRSVEVYGGSGGGGGNGGSDRNQAWTLLPNGLNKSRHLGAAVTVPTTINTTTTNHVGGGGGGAAGESVVVLAGSNATFHRTCEYYDAQRGVWTMTNSTSATTRTSNYRPSPPPLLTKRQGLAAVAIPLPTQPQQQQPNSSSSLSNDKLAAAAAADDSADHKPAAVSSAIDEKKVPTPTASTTTTSTAASPSGALIVVLGGSSGGTCDLPLQIELYEWHANNRQGNNHNKWWADVDLGRRIGNGNARDSELAECPMPCGRYKCAAVYIPHALDDEEPPFYDWDEMETRDFDRAAGSGGGEASLPWASSSSLSRPSGYFPPSSPLSPPVPPPLQPPTVGTAATITITSIDSTEDRGIVDRNVHRIVVMGGQGNRGVLDARSTVDMLTLRLAPQHQQPNLPTNNS